MMSKYKYNYIDPCVFADTDDTGCIQGVKLSSNSVMLYGKETVMRRDYQFHSYGVCEALKSMIDDHIRDEEGYVDLNHLCRIMCAINGAEFDEMKQFLKDGVDKVFQTKQPHVFKPVDEEE